MRCRVLFVWLAALCMLCGVAGAQEWRHEPLGLPEEVVEGQFLRFRVVYRVPESAGTVRLNIEIKDTRNVVHLAERRQVRGAGTADVALKIPADKFRGSLLAAVWFGEDWRQPLAPILHSRPVTVLTRNQADILERAAREAVGIRRRLGLREGRPVTAVLSGGWAGRDAAMARNYQRALQAAGVPAVLIGPDEIANPSVLNARYVKMLVIPQAPLFPGPALPPLERYLRRGGHLIALGAPAFDRQVQKIGAEWMEVSRLNQKMLEAPATTMLADFSTVTRDQWTRSTNNFASRCEWQMVTDSGVRALQVSIDSLTGWDTLTLPLTVSPRRGETYLRFRAKGGPQTTALMVEAREEDGSRWIATVPLYPQWRKFAVHESDFVLWDPEGRSGRNSPDDHLSLERARSITVGLAYTHTRLPGGAHRYWFAEPGASPGPSWVRYHPLTLDTLSPVYKYYPVRGATALDDSAGRALAGPAQLSLPKKILSTHPRPTAGGFLKQRGWRWIPLIQVTGKQGVAGTLATMLCHHDDGYGRGVWVSFTAAEDSWYARPEVVRYTARLASRILNAPLLAEGGAEFFGIFPDDTLLLGASAYGPQMSRAQVRLQIFERASGRPIFQKLARVGDIGTHSEGMARWKPGDHAQADRYRVVATLLLNGRPIDSLQHEITVRRPRTDPSFLKTANGQFVLNGKVWSAHGVNYMPSSGLAIEDGPFFELWMSRRSYDPVVIERDLSRVRAMGFNMVSAFIYTESTHNRNLVDFLNRCDRHGLKVNLSLRPGTPLDFEWPAIGEIIRVNRLANDDTIIAYDLAWEPMWGGYEQRRRWDPEWRQWITERYGSLEAAEADWGAPAPRSEGQVTGLRDSELIASSPIPRVAAAYRRFLDDLLSRKYMEARQKIRAVDANHLLSFRMTITGDPTADPRMMAYDFAGVARSMDFMAPEGYGRLGGWEQVKPGRFTVDYARLRAPDKPVLWAEFGYTLWDPAAATPSRQQLDFAAAFERRFYPPAALAYTENFYRAFLRMALESGSAVTVCWWYPGGYRAGENSDFGIINPDGTWRSLSRILWEHAPRFLNRTAFPTPDTWLTVDRDLSADALFGIYIRHKDEYWRLIGAGRTPGLRTEATGTTSANTPLIAVGNTPCNGSNPPKYLNAEFERLEVLDASGQWTTMPFGQGEVRVKAGQPIRIRAVLGNNGEAAWIAAQTPDQTGAVYLSISAEPFDVMLSLPGDVPTLGTSGLIEGELPAVAGDVTLTFTCVARHRSQFGERRRVLLRVE
jgi:hypothetical protein